MKIRTSASPRVAGHHLLAPTRTLIATAAIATPLALIGCGDDAASPTSPGGGTTTVATSADLAWHSARGEDLLAAANCTACHIASDDAKARIGAAPAPEVLGDAGVGSRLSPAAIRDRLGAHGGELGMRMPDLLHGLPETDREQATEELVHFLASQGGPLGPDAALLELPTAAVTQGETLWKSIGCTTCHGADAEHGLGMENLAASWSRPALQRFLLDPAAVHRAGRMPSFNLTTDEASSLSAYLLSTADGATVVRSRPGLRLELWNGGFQGMGPMDETRPADLSDRVDVPEVGPGKGRDNFGLRLTGEIEIPTDGRWNFFLTSDDGGGLRIDDTIVVDHGGIHAPSPKRGAINLTAGRHPITISMFEASGGEEVSLSWSGPGVERQPVPASAFSSDLAVVDPGWAPFELDEDLRKGGMMRFARLGCGACHVPGMPLLGDLATLPPLGSLTAGQGCLAAEVPAKAPDYGFTADERSLLAEVVANAAALDEPLPADLAVAHAMTSLNCIACHARPEVGGPSPERLALFTSNDDAELGDEGRVPPALDDVGNKLRLEAIADILARGTKVRPYMHARMPVFAAPQIADLPTNLSAADAIAADGREPTFTPELATIGHRLVGTDGVSCVQCHTAGGHPALGVPAVDLASMHRRLRPGWFRKHLLDPQKTNPGTRMTAFWGNGGTDRIFAEVLGGDPVKQVDAIRSYLSLGESMPLPKGVVPDAGEYALVPSDRPIVFGTFMDGVSPRTIAVGLPDNVHYAYDAENARLAKAWRGAFMDARGTWHGRAGELESPEGRSVIEMPEGAAIAALDTRADAWPEPNRRDAAGVRNGAWRFAGTSRDADGRPAFHVEIDGVRITERPLPRLAEGGSRLVREFRVASDEGRGDLYARLAVAGSIEPAGGEGDNRRWRTADGLMIEIRGADSFVRDGGDGTTELIVKVPLRMVGRDDAAFEGVFEAEIGW